jgi:hypothetical protein
MLATGLSGCDFFSDATDRVRTDVTQATGEPINIDVDRNDGRLTQVAVTFQRPYDGKPIGELADAIRKAVITEFKEKPQKLLLAFEFKPGSETQSSALPSPTQHTVSTAPDGMTEAIAALEADLGQATGETVVTDADWHNGDLTQVTVTFKGLYDGKPIGELAATVSKAAAAEFKQTPQKILLTFEIKPGSEAQTNALLAATQHARLAAAFREF